jgi:hypothetical protein
MESEDSILRSPLLLNVDIQVVSPIGYTITAFDFLPPTSNTYLPHLVFLNCLS